MKEAHLASYLLISKSIDRTHSLLGSTPRQAVGVVHPGAHSKGYII